jgi:UDP-glucose 4-epimerase
MGRVVLVTGVGRYLGARAAALLAADPGVDRVLAVDMIAPRGDVGSAEFIRADLRSNSIGRIIAHAEVDTVVHMNVLATPKDLGGRAPQKDINVIGTMQLLAACQASPLVRSIVVKSATSVYGASPRDPSAFTEDMSAKVPPRSGYGKDTIEVENYVRGFARRRPNVATTMLRFANFIGPSVRTPFTEYFTLPVVPTVLGYDARLQFIHEDDGLAAICVAALGRVPGTFNIAGDGVILLSQAVHRCGRVPVPTPAPAAGVLGGVFRRFRLADFSPEQVKLLTYGRVVDTSRAREELGFSPSMTTQQAFADFVAARCADGVLDPARVAAAEQSVVRTVTRGRAHG